MFLDGSIQYCNDVTSLSNYSVSQCNLNQDHNLYRQYFLMYVFLTDRSRIWGLGPGETLSPKAS